MCTTGALQRELLRPSENNRQRAFAAALRRAPPIESVDVADQRRGQGKLEAKPPQMPYRWLSKTRLQQIRLPPNICVFVLVA